jgi:rod shape-determining protein MreC
MQFSSQNRKILIIVAGLILIFSLNIFYPQVKNSFYFISQPLQKNFWQAGIKTSDFFKAVTNIENLKLENKRLILENQKLLAEIMLLKEAERENKILREALEIGLSEDFDLVLAEITAKDTDQDSILINRGKRDNLAVGMPVINQQRVLFGKISKVYRDFSKVSLISNKKSSFDAKISDRKISGIVRGLGRSRIIFDLIPKEQEIKEGDLVQSSSLGGIYPKDLLVGLIKSVKKADTEPFQQAEIVPFFDISETETIFVVTNY